MSTNDPSPQPEPIKFDRNVGRKLFASEALGRTAAYRKDEESRGRKRGDYTESEFFGIDAIQGLIDQHPGCVGIRFYYGINARDAEGYEARRLTLVAVDAAGQDLFRGGDLRGLKDEGDGETLGDGYDCPRRCPT